MEIEYENKFFNPDITAFYDLAKQMAKAFGYAADIKVDKKLGQLLRLRVAQANSCAYCVILHSKAAMDVGIPEAKVDNISSWWNSDLYTVKEKAALAYCDALNDGKVSDFQEHHELFREYLSEQEIAAIVINMNVWTRLKLAQGQTPFFTE